MLWVTLAVPVPAAEPKLLSRLLSPITEVRPGEAVTALLLTLNVFLLLAAYYVIKPVREALILSEQGGAEYKAYLSGAIAITLLFAVPAYARFASILPRLKLVVGVSLFFAAHLLVFYSLGTAYREPLGLGLSLVFYVWVGIFNMMVVAQFWAFANDLYTEEQGKRLFPLVALGASIGAAGGSKIAGELIPVVGLFSMLLVGAGVLAICAALFWVVEHREQKPTAERTAKPSHIAGEKGAFQLVFGNRYLLGVALFALIFSVVNSNGEYLLGKLVKAAAADAVSSGEVARGAEGEFIGATYGDFFFIVNVLGVLLQAFVVSRLVRWMGVSRALFVFPAIALGDAVLVAVLPVLAAIKVGKAAENAVDYSLNNTLRQILWLVTTREQKYKAKQAVDSFFVRMGDVSSALLVWVLASQLSFSVRQFAVVNALIVVVWIFVMVLVAREYRKLERARSSEPEPNPSS